MLQQLSLWLWRVPAALQLWLPDGAPQGGYTGPPIYSLSAPHYFNQLFHISMHCTLLKMSLSSLQFAVAAGLAACMMDINAVRSFFSNSPLWTFIIICTLPESPHSAAAFCLAKHLPG